MGQVMGKTRTGFQRWLLSSAAIVAVLGTGPAWGESLQEALVSAYETNPTLLAERARLRAIDETLPQASSGWKPTIVLSGTYGETEGSTKLGGVTTDVDTEPVTGTATLTQPVFRGGRTFFNVMQARANVRAGRARLHNVEQQILLSAVAAYFDVIRDEATVELARNNVVVLDRQLQAAKDRFEVGEITRTDVAQAEARKSRIESVLIASEAQLTASRSAYEQIIGRMPGSLERKVDLPALPGSEAEALELARQLNPTLIAARETERASSHGVKSATGQLLPSLSVRAQYLHSETSLSDKTQTDTTSIVGELTVPIYQAGAEYASIRQAKHTNSQNRMEIAAAQREVEANVVNAWEGLRSARASILSNREQVRAAEIALEGVQQEAQVGSRTTLDVLDAEQELLDARVALVQTQRDEFVAAYNLLAVSGRLRASDLQLPVDVYDPTNHTKSLIWKQAWPGAGERR